MNIAKGTIPDDIEEVSILEESINICDLLVKVNFANSKSEAKRMIQGNGVKINSKGITNINELIDLKDEIVIQFGKNRFKRVIKNIS